MASSHWEVVARERRGRLKDGPLVFTMRTKMRQFHKRGHWNQALLLGGQPEKEEWNLNEILDETFPFLVCLIITMI